MFLHVLNLMHIFTYSSMGVFIVLKPIIIKLINAYNLVFWSKVNFIFNFICTICIQKNTAYFLVFISIHILALVIMTIFHVVVYRRTLLFFTSNFTRLRFAIVIVTITIIENYRLLRYEEDGNLTIQSDQATDVSPTRLTRRPPGMIVEDSYETSVHCDNFYKHTADWTQPIIVVYRDDLMSKSHFCLFYTCSQCKLLSRCPK